MLTITQIEQVTAFLKGLALEHINIMDHINDVNDIDLDNPVGSIYNLIIDDGGFDVDITYYSTAIEYLAKNDYSLRISLGLANDMGFDLDKLNSEVLASLLASENTRDEFNEYRSEIEDFFNDLINN